MQKAKKAADADRAERRAFCVACSSKRQALKAAAAAHKGGGGRGKGAKAKPAPVHAKGGKGAKGLAVPALALPPGAITQREAKAFVPEGGKIWRSWCTGAWMGRWPPYGYHSRAWHTHGHHNAATLVLRAVWRDFLDHHGLQDSACTVAGLF